MLRVVVEKSEKLAVTGNYTQGSWNHQCFATELRQLNIHQPS